MSSSEKPASLGGQPIFDEPIPLIRPSLHIDDELFSNFRTVLESGMLTNASNVCKFEEQVANFLGVEHVVATSNCTSGLMLVLKCLAPNGEVIAPSFTFMATGHAIVWNGLIPVFADSDLRTCNVEPESILSALSSDTKAVMATHVFGAPVDIDAIEDIATRNGLPLIIDAAHGFGARYPDGTRVGTKGLAEVFSLSPTKTLTAGEGGLVATRDGALANELRFARDYGNRGDYDCEVVGLNSRMTEISAVVGRTNLTHLPRWLEQRRTLVARYVSRLSQVPGIHFQELLPNAVSTYKDFSIRIVGQEFGINRDELAIALECENIPTRKYFHPPLHRQKAYLSYKRNDLPNADKLAEESITLPLYSEMSPMLIDRVCSAITRIYEHRREVVARNDTELAEIH